MSLNCHKKDSVLLFIDYGKFIDIVVKLGKHEIEVWGFFAKQKDENSSIIM